MGIKPGQIVRNLLLMSLLFVAGAARAAVDFAVNVNPNAAQPNQQVVVGITVTNSGVATTSNLTVTLAYPSNMANIYEDTGLVTGPVNAGASCGTSYPTICSAGETLQWDLGNLTPGQAVHLSLSPTVANATPDGTLIPWQVTVSDDSGALGTESATLTVDSTPALTVAIDENQDPVPAGDTLTYTLRYGNRSTNSVTGTQLSFTLPANTSFVSATGGGTPSGNVVSWSLNTLPAGAIAQQVVQVSVDPGAVNGTLLESEAVIDGTTNALPTERHATSTAYVGAHPPLALALNVNPLPAQPNQQVVVELTVTNPTASTVFGGVVQLHYPSNMANIYEDTGLVTGPVNAGASCGTSYPTICSAGETLQWDLGNLTPGQAVHLSLSPTVANATPDGTLIPWQVTVSDDSGALGTESATLTVDSTPALTVAIDENQDPVPAGDTLTYTLRYGNRSTNSVTGTQLSFTLPANTSFVSATGGGTPSGNVVSWSLNTLPAGAIAQQVVQVSVDPGAVNGTLLESEAVIDGTTNALPTERHATSTAYVGAHPPLALALNVNPLPAQPNQQVVVELTVTNPTASTVFGGVVQLHYPSNMANIYEDTGLVTGPVNAGASCGTSYPTICSAGETLQWDLGNLTPGQAVHLSLSPTVANATPDGTLIPWQVTVSDDSGALGTESATLTVDSTPALTVAIDENQDPVPAGDTLTYTLRYGNRSTNSVTGTQLSFTLPANTSFVSATGGGTPSGNVVSWSLNTLPAGAIAQQVVQVSVDPGAVNGTLLESEAVIDGTTNALPTERHATSTAYVGAHPPLALALNVNPLPAQPNQQVVVELTVTNPTASTVFGGVVQLHYPSNMANIYEDTGLVTGPVNAGASCGTSYPTICSAGETLQWDLGNLTPGQAVHLSLSPTVANGTPDGTLIPWSALVTDDSLSLGRVSETLPLGVGCLADSDGDGVCDDVDNCTLVSNPSQLDTDADNIGNMCDCDFNQDNFCGGPDFTLFIGCFNKATGSNPVCKAADMNGDGFVGGPDFSLFIGGFNGPPGPSGP